MLDVDQSKRRIHLECNDQVIYASIIIACCRQVDLNKFSVPSEHARKKACSGRIQEDARQLQLVLTPNNIKVGCIATNLSWIRWMV